MSTDISLEAAIGAFLAHKRALGRKYLSEERELRLLTRSAAERDLRLHDLNPAVLQEFLGARPRSRPRSFNHLLSVTGGLLRWALAQELLETAPALPRPRKNVSGRIPFLFTTAQARDLLTAASRLPDNARARGRGQVHHGVFALCYGLGLRAGEACGLGLGDIDEDRSLLVVRGGKFGKTGWSRTGLGSALWWPRRHSGDVSRILRPGHKRHCSLSTVGTASTPAPPARFSTSSYPPSICPFRTASRRRDCMISVIRSRSAACCVGIAKTVTRSRACTNCPRSWDTSTPSPRRCI